MPIGPITPGSPVTVSPDASLSPYASLQGPSPTMPVVAQDVLELTLATLNIQDFAAGELANLIAALAAGITTGHITVTTGPFIVSAGSSSFAGAVTFAGSTSHFEDMTFRKTLKMTNYGHVQKRPPVTLPASNAPISLDDGDMFFIPSGSTANYTPDTTGLGAGQAGAELIVSSSRNTSATTVYCTIGGSAGALPMAFVSSGLVSLLLTWTGTVWEGTPLCYKP